MKSTLGKTLAGLALAGVIALGFWIGPQTSSGQNAPPSSRPSGPLGSSGSSREGSSRDSGSSGSRDSRFQPRGSSSSSRDSRFDPSRAPATRPYTRPTYIPSSAAFKQVTSVPMPASFEAIRNRSIFTREQSRPPEVVRAEAAPTTGPATTAPAIAVAPPPPPRPEQGLVLRGVTLEDETMVAFVEDVPNVKTFRVIEGEHVANRGQVVEITFDGIDYEYQGHVTSVGLGQNLDGQYVSLAPIVPVIAAAAPTTGPTTGPSTTPAAPPMIVITPGTPAGTSAIATPDGSSGLPPANEAAILEAMRAKRASQGGR